MWPFKRQQTIDTSNLPEEVQEYYQSQQREHIGLAWLLAFGTLVVTVAALFGIFFGSRWAYHKLAHKTVTPSHSQTAANTNKTSQSTGNSESASSASQPATTNPTSNTTTPSTTNSSTDQTQSTTPSISSSSSSTASTPSTTSGLTTTTSGSQTPTSSSSLSNTGPANLLPIFLIVSTLSGSLHWTYQRRTIRNR